MNLNPLLKYLGMQIIYSIYGIIIAVFDHLPLAQWPNHHESNTGDYSADAHQDTHVIHRFFF